MTCWRKCSDSLISRVILDNDWGSYFLRFLPLTWLHSLETMHHLLIVGVCWPHNSPNVCQYIRLQFGSVIEPQGNTSYADVVADGVSLSSTPSSLQPIHYISLSFLLHLYSINKYCTTLNQWWMEWTNYMKVHKKIRSDFKHHFSSA